MTNEDYRQPSVDKSPSPIGAGLPLLQRLKMLKEKQVKGYNYYSLVHRYTFVLISVSICTLLEIITDSSSYYVRHVPRSDQYKLIYYYYMFV